MSAARISRVVVVGRDAPLWLAAGVLQHALAPSGVTVRAVELPGSLTDADVYATLPPLEALHAQLGVDEGALLRQVRGAFSLGQNFVDTTAGTAPFLHAFGCCGTRIGTDDFFPHWLKARSLGLDVALEHFSLTAAAARHARLLFPDDQTDLFGPCGYGYHLPAIGYAAALAGIAVHHGVRVSTARSIAIERASESGAIAALTTDDGDRIEGDLFIDATGPGGDLIGALGVPRWRSDRPSPADRVLTASGPAFTTLPAYAELRASEHGWLGLYPSQARTHIAQAYSSALRSDDDALRSAAATAGFALGNAVVRVLEPGARATPWTRNCVAIGEAAGVFDPVHSVALHAVQLGLVLLLARFPAGAAYESERNAYNAAMQSAFARIDDFQAAHYLLNRYGGSAFWAQARQIAPSPKLADDLATFAARGELSPREAESFSPDSWRMLLIGHGLIPVSYPPSIDRTPPETVKDQFRAMLAFVREQVLRQPSHADYLAELDRTAHA